MRDGWLNTYPFTLQDLSLPQVSLEVRADPPPSRTRCRFYFSFSTQKRVGTQDCFAYTLEEHSCWRPRESLLATGTQRSGSVLKPR